MRTVSAPFTAALALLAVACGPKPPTVCASISQQRVFIGETETVEYCFEDPGGGALTFAVASADESVVSAFPIRDESVGIGGVSPGETTVSVTATNEKELTTETEFSVLVPNRAPVFTSEMETSRVPVNQSLLWILPDFFTEPDGEEMTFTATSSDNAVVSVLVVGSSVRVSGVSGGEAQVTVAATDPHRAEATGTILVTATTRTTVFQDDFDTVASLDDWTTNDHSRLSVEDGALHIEPLTDGFYGVAIRETDLVTRFDIDLRFKPGAESQTGVIWRTGETNPNHEAYIFVTGKLTLDEDSANWAFARFQQLTWHIEFSGTSDLFEFDEYADFTLSLSEGDIRIAVGDDVLLSGTINGAVPVLRQVRLAAAGEIGEFDYAALNGFLTDDPGADTRKITLPLLDMRIGR